MSKRKKPAREVEALENAEAAGAADAGTDVALAEPPAEPEPEADPAPARGRPKKKAAAAEPPAELEAFARSRGKKKTEDEAPADESTEAEPAAADANDAPAEPARRGRKAKADDATTDTDAEPAADAGADAEAEPARRGRKAKAEDATADPNAGVAAGADADAEPARRGRKAKAAPVAEPEPDDDDAHDTSVIDSVPEPLPEPPPAPKKGRGKRTVEDVIASAHESEPAIRAAEPAGDGAEAASDDDGDFGGGYSGNLNDLDIEMTVNVAGDALLDLPGRDDLDAPTIDVAGEQLGEVDKVIDQRRYLRGCLEALIFASDTPLRPKEMASLADTPIKAVLEALDELRAEYATRGLHLEEVAGGWVFRTSPEYSAAIRDLRKERPVRLTRAQVETLAIIAYRQPVTRPEIDDVRGVDSGPVLKLLLERDLVRILGKRDEVGRPIIYGTTNAFLEFFGLNSLKDLPTLREFTELTEESREKYEEELGEMPVAPEPEPAPEPPPPAAPEAPKPSAQEYEDDLPLDEDATDVTMRRPDTLVDEGELNNVAGDDPAPSEDEEDDDEDDDDEDDDDDDWDDDDDEDDDDEDDDDDDDEDEDDDE